MSAKKIFFVVTCLITTIFFTSCNTDEGEGGTGSIEGKVYLIQHPDDNYNLETDTIAAAKTDIFIVYGNDDYFGDDMETDADGFYRFKYLTPGNYTVYAYSTLSTGEKIAVPQTVTIKRGESGVVPNIYIHEGKAYGTSIIKGSVYATYMHNGDIVGQGWALEHRVYIRNIDDPYPFDDVRVAEDGIFMFQKILPGTYEIFTITEDEEEIPSVISQTVTVSEAGTIVELPTIFNVTINV